MGTSRLLTVGLVAGSVLIASVFAAAPASAATLPTGQKISVLERDTGQFSYASPVSAALTPTGTGVGVEDTLLLGVDVKDDGKGFAVGTQQNIILIPNGLIFPADAATGTLGDGVYVKVLEDGDPVEEAFSAEQCTAIDFSGAEPWVSCTNFIEGEEFTLALSFVGPIDPVSGILTPAFEVVGGNANPVVLSPTEMVTSIALDPTTGNLWVFTFDYSTGNGWAYIWTEDGGIDFIGGLPEIVGGADFDRDGTLWITTIETPAESEATYPALGILNIEFGEVDFLEIFTVDEIAVDEAIEAITVWGAAPALAATGSTPPAGLAAGAAGILLLGALLAAGVAMRRRMIAE